MAKDGTQRGGARPGAGRKPKALKEKLLEGRINNPNTILRLGDSTSSSLSGEDMPPVDDYMKAHQKNGIELRAEEVFRETTEWINSRGCRDLVNPQLVKQYSMAVARWIQCEEAISEFGFLAKHPTTGAAIASPYVTMENQYMKAINQCWYQIAAIVKEHSADGFGSSNPQDDLMERLLRSGG